MGTPNWILTEEQIFREYPHDERVLPKGMFVRPVDIKYVPKHVLEDPRWKFMHPPTEVFIYCRYGFFVVPKDKIRKV